MASSTAEAQQVRDGVANLIRNCVGVQSGESVLLLNEHGGVDPGVVSLMEDGIREAGGTAYSMWVDPLTGMREMPKLLGNAIVAADKVVMNANLNRVILLEHLRANDRADLVRINNRTRTPDRIGSEHARFDWRLVMELAHKIEEITAAATEWEITTPHGTRMQGRIASGSDVADAFFVQDAEASRTERVFPGEVYAPVGSKDAHGIIAFDHPGIADKERFANPIMVTVEDNMVTGIEWREEAARPNQPNQKEDPTGSTVWTRAGFIRLLDANEEKYGHERAYVVDSWHGGMHPKAEKRAGQQSDTKTMHFHIGRVPSARSTYMSDQTVVLDGVPFWENGRPALLDDPAVQAMAAEYGQKLS